MSFDISELRNSTVWQLYRMRDRVQLDPEYQRLSGIWAPDNRQLLVDTILNGFDVPKLYLHKFSKPLMKSGKTYDYAIIDGKQRLETMWAFIDGHLALASDFKFFKDEGVTAHDMSYRDLGLNYPELKADFDGFRLSVMCIETDDIEMIEEMFSRLNEAAPLTAAEKRNAYGGPIPAAVRKLAKGAFFTKCLPFPNNRYRHFDLAAKCLLTERENKVVDTKKVHLDNFAEAFDDKPRNRMPSFVKHAEEELDRMAQVFVASDSLLRQVGMVMLYYNLFRYARLNAWKADRITRRKLLDFNKLRETNRAAAESGARADYELIEFERHSQSPNDGYAIRFRLHVLLDRSFNEKVAVEAL